MDQKLHLDISFHQCGPEVQELAINFSSDYLDYMENVPFSLQKHVTKLREVDQKCREHVEEIESLYEKFTAENEGNNSSTGIKKRSSLAKIRQLFALCKELGDEKIAIVQGISEVLEARNKQLEMNSKKFLYAYNPNLKHEHNGKMDRDMKADSAKGTKRSRRQRNNHGHDKQEKNSHAAKEEKSHKESYLDDEDEPPAKISSSTTQSSSSQLPSSPALTRASVRDEDKRSTAKSTKDKKEEKSEKKDDDPPYVAPSSGKASVEVTTTSVSTVTLSSAVSSTAAGKQASNNVNSSSSPSTNNKNNMKGKKKKRKTNKHQTERQTSNSGNVSPLLDMPIDPDEPTYCICQQVSFGQMIGCDNPKCPIEWFHFSCLRLSHKPKGKWYCPDCTIKMKEKKRESKRGENR